ncbi:hypothetical protein PAAG_01781 [Paracoccidioides lutzii Pb01]|uniref:Respiratory complex assembly protein Rmp1 n=1 Tax=Paracoccidioides lutzii (strain ATCC MYA-826 / Pb01) TaxID=502779 RepID=C1GTD6_PARBA|nr:hypothetical protein PAAG_01781 [Paracoccidioides lutzii Pb01]EEH39592.2 hypothetical protein PAAG_01781 [Paracoccidioides lutzii Pb01]
MFKASSSQNVVACLRCQFCSPRSQKALTTCINTHTCYGLHQNRYHSTTTPSSRTKTNPKLYPVLSIKKSRYRRHVARLDVQTLGEVGDVVILKERASRPKQMTARKFSRILEKETYGDAPWENPSELLREVDRTRYQMGDAKEAIENIDKIRFHHKPGDKLNRNEWRRLRKVLEDGFTANQLSDYHKQFEPLVNPADQEECSTISSSGWRPGTSLFLEIDPEAHKQTASRIGSLQNMTGKVALAETVLRDCWKLSVSGEIGQLDIHLTPQEISMLLLPDTSPLSDLATAYSAKIDVFRSLNLVRITANETSCEFVRNGVMEYLPKILSKTVELPSRGYIFHGKNRRFEDRFFRLMQKSFHVFCRKESAREIKIYFVHELEKEADEAYRNIKSAISMIEEDQAPFCTYLPDVEPAVMYSVAYPEFLSWVDRQRRWLRWMKPLSESKIPSGTQSKPPTALIQTDHASALTKVCNELFKKPVSVTWRNPGQPHVREVVVASLGKSLFSHQKLMKPGKMNFKSLSPTVPRAFAANIPNPIAFLQDLTPLLNDGNATLHRIHLTPSPTDKLRLPPIELELEVLLQFEGRRRLLVPILRKASIVVHRVSMDVLLPETSVDLRFTKFTHYDLLEGKDPSTLLQTDGQRADISSILQLIRIMVCEDAFRQTRMPVSCQLSIPRKLLFNHSSAIAVDSQAHGEVSDFVTGTYLLPPVHYLRSTQISRFNYKELELNFSHVHMGLALPEHVMNMSLSLGRDESELRPEVCQPNTRLSSTIADGKSHGSLRVAFEPFYIRACEMAFEQSAAAANYKGDVGAEGRIGCTGEGNYRRNPNLEPEDRFYEWLEKGADGEFEDRFNSKARSSLK